MASVSDKVLTNPNAEDCLLPTAITSQNVAASESITHATPDAFAVHSFSKPNASQKASKFKDKIAPIEVKWVDPMTEEEKDLLIDSDDGIRDGVTPESLGKLKPAFKNDGSTLAVSNGAAAVLLTKQSTAKRLSIPILGKCVTSAVISVPPKIMVFRPV
ncbi:hypothetical protein H1R20_g1515, partial [Candolleomyces eurysporus]